MVIDNAAWMRLGAWALEVADDDEEVASEALHAAMQQIDSGTGFARRTEESVMNLIEAHIWRIRG